MAEINFGGVALTYLFFDVVAAIEDRHLFTSGVVTIRLH